MIEKRGAYDRVNKGRDVFGEIGDAFESLIEGVVALVLMGLGVVAFIWLIKTVWNAV